MFIENTRDAKLAAANPTPQKAAQRQPTPLRAAGEKLNGHEGYLRLTAFLKKNPMLGF